MITQQNKVVAKRLAFAATAAMMLGQTMFGPGMDAAGRSSNEGYVEPFNAGGLPFDEEARRECMRKNEESYRPGNAIMGVGYALSTLPFFYSQYTRAIPQAAGIALFFSFIASPFGEEKPCIARGLEVGREKARQTSPESPSSKPQTPPASTPRL